MHAPRACTSPRTQHQDERAVGLGELLDDGHHQLLHLLHLARVPAKGRQTGRGRGPSQLGKGRWEGSCPQVMHGVARA